mgnify:CR=1 FL=1
MEEQDFFGEIWHMMRSKYVINFTIGYEKAKVVSLATALARVGFLHRYCYTSWLPLQIVVMANQSLFT